MYRVVYLKSGTRQDELRDMWQRVFEDDASFIDGFYGAMGAGMEVVAAMDDSGMLASAAHFIPVTMRMGKATVKGSYLYAAMTLPEHRGQSLMGGILAKRMLRGYDAGEVFMCTLPASESLYDLYAKYGFGGAFMLSRAVMSRVELSAMKLSQPFESRVSPEYAYRGSYGAREFTVLKNRLFVDYTASDNEGAGGEFLPFYGGYMYVRPEEDAGVYVKEIFAAGENLPYAACLLLRKFPKAEKFTFDFCPDMAPPGQEVTPVRAGAFRVLNAPAAFRLYAARHPAEGRTFNLTDEVIPQNSGGYRCVGGRVVWGDAIPEAQGFDAGQIAMQIATDGERCAPYMNMMLD
ncbi:MAG TPA: GNAT family N-acetyltransferase [Terriglobales bacterium]|nr:GNAT family N-acetyltransferase [Terriglobales bacterium]